MHIAHGKFFQACKCTDPEGSVDRFRGVCVCVNARWAKCCNSITLALFGHRQRVQLLLCEIVSFAQVSAFCPVPKKPTNASQHAKGKHAVFSSCFASVIPMPATYEIYLGWEEENCLWYLRKHGWHWLFCSVGQRNLTVNNGDGQRWKLNGDLSFVIAEMRNLDTLLWNSTETTLNSTMRY